VPTDSSAAASQVSDTAPASGSPSITVPPSTEDEVDDGYLSVSEFSNEVLLRKLHKLRFIQCMVTTLTDSEERDNVDKQLSAINVDIERCKDANLVHHHKTIHNKYLEVKATT
jgi:hypothetical protein